MLVSELIDKLQQMPSDRRVIVGVFKNNGEPNDIFSVDIGNLASDKSWSHADNSEDGEEVVLITA